MHGNDKDHCDPSPRRTDSEPPHAREPDDAKPERSGNAQPDKSTGDVEPEGSDAESPRHDHEPPHDKVTNGTESQHAKPSERTTRTASSDGQPVERVESQSLASPVTEPVPAKSTVARVSPQSVSIPGHVAAAAFLGIAAVVGALVWWMASDRPPPREPEVVQTSGDESESPPVRSIAAEESDPEDEWESQRASRGLGELRAKKPGETKERTDAVRLVRHHVRARIVGAVAKTEVDEVFRNNTNEVLEGIFRFPLPADAQIERLALEVDGQLVEGAFTDRERAAAIWRGSIVQAAPQLRAQIKEEIIWVPGPWRDPALLEWQRGNHFELRIYPIPKQGSRRIVLSYTQIVPGTSARRSYTYPLPKQSGELPALDEFSLDLELRGHDPQSKPRVVGYTSRLNLERDEAARLRIDEQRFIPHGDLFVEYAMPNADKELIAWSHQPAGGESSYLAMLLRPQLARARERGQHAYAIVVDTSRSMFGENLKRAVALATRMVRETAPDDRVMVLACDNECRTWPEGSSGGGRMAAQAARSWLSTQTAEGASDITGALASAAAALGRASAERTRHIIYVGDGTATAGPTRPATISAELRHVLGASHVDLTAVAVGADSDLEGLRAVARGGHGVVIPYLPGTSLARVASLAMGSTLGARVEDVTLDLPPGVQAVSPQRIDTIAAGDERLIVAKLRSPALRGDVVLRGSIGDVPFERRYRLDVEASAGERNAFVPRLWAASRILDLERSGDVQAKREAIELSSRFSVASRYTSLLVLESQAMFDAFGLDNRRKAATWSGELEDSASGAETEVDEQENSESLQTTSEAAIAGAAGPSPRFESPAPASAKASRVGAASAMEDGASMAAPAPARPAPGVRATRKRAEGAPAEADQAAQIAVDPRPDWIPTRPRRWIPMRRIWERRGEILTDRRSPANVTPEKIAAAERELQQNPDRRSSTKKLLELYLRGGDLDRAEELTEGWAGRDPLDVEVLVARADIAARRGSRALAVRILGSVLDVRPSDVGAQQRLGRLMRWSGQPTVACRFATALAEFHPSDEKALAEALRCLGELGDVELAQGLRGAAEDKVLRSAERLLQKARPAEALSGDIRVTATWHGAGAVDLDLSLIDPDAHRVSWLGAPTRAVISAIDAVGLASEGLALRGGKPGEYVLELVRGTGEGRVAGTVTVQLAGSRAQIPFSLDGDRLVLAILRVTTVPRLVPVGPSPQPVGLF